MEKKNVHDVVAHTDLAHVARPRYDAMCRSDGMHDVSSGESVTR